MGGAMHPGNCSLKATLRGGDRERPSSIPSLALKDQLRIISVSFSALPNQRLRASGCTIFTKDD